MGCNAMRTRTFMQVSAVPICMVLMGLLFTLSNSIASESSVHSDSAAVNRCYAWKVRVNPNSKETAKPKTQAVESILSSRCRAEIPACKISVEVLCGQSLESEPPVPCHLCGTPQCDSKRPICRYVSRTFKNGNCETASTDVCYDWARMCVDVTRIREQYYEELKALCPQATDDFEIRLRTEPATP